MAVNVAGNIHAGLNTVAVRASAGDAFAIKIVPAAQGIEASALIISDAAWKGASSASIGWEQPAFDDSAWSMVQAFGSIESDFHRFQGNYDLGMYQWPGYEGLSATLDHVPLETASARNVDSLGIMLDFGKEVSGRLEVTSLSTMPIHLKLNLGESEGEATPEFSFLSTRELVVPPMATVHGPLTAFRFARVSFDDGLQAQAWQASMQIRADQVFLGMPVQGSFQSSDDRINQIWQTSVYTAQLNLQSTIWDAPKRDRNPFSGDLLVAGRAVQAAFGDTQIARDTLQDLLRRVSLVVVTDIFSKDINGIPAYNGWWVVDLADQYRYSGDLAYLQSHRDDLLQVLDTMASELDQGYLFANTSNATVFADWSPGMIQFGAVQAPETFKITTFVYSLAFSQAAWLFTELGQPDLGGKYQAMSNKIRDAAKSAYLDSSTGTFGDRMQTNAMAVFSGVADPATTDNVFSQVLSQPPTQPVSPYFNYFVISAMAQADHRAEALAAIRQYWGSMLDAGATSFWEVYDPKCVTSTNVHACLLEYFDSIDNQGTNRYFVSLAHSWSSGPAPWLHEQILGLTPMSPGFKTVQIRPDLAGLQWARGEEPTPNGNIAVNIVDSTHVEIDLPGGTDAYVSMPTPSNSAVVLVNGETTIGSFSENGTRTIVPLSHGSHYALQSF